MAQTKPRTETAAETVDLAAADADFAALAARVARTRARVLVERDGRPLAAIVPAIDLDRLARFDAEWEADMAVFDEIGAAFAGVDPEEIERETAKALAEVRAEMRAEREAATREAVANQ